MPPGEQTENELPVQRIKQRQYREIKGVKVKRIKREASAGEEGAEENVILEFPFSSEEAVDQWWGRETLSHEKDAVVLDRLNNHAPILYNHLRNILLGKSNKGWLADDKRCHVQAKMSRTKSVQEHLTNIEDEILVNVSCAYDILDWVMTRKNDDGPDEYTITRWSPYEVSFVTVPADNSVGLLRSDEPEDGAEIEIRTKATPPAPRSARNLPPAVDNVQQEKNKKQEPKVQITINERNKMPPNEQTPEQIREQIRTEENQRTSEVLDLGEKTGMQEFAREMLNSKKSLREIKDEFLKKYDFKKVVRTEKDGNIGMDDKEVAEYSYAKAVRCLLDPSDAKAKDAAGFEREVSREAEIKYGVSARGLIIPMDVQRDRRDLQITDPAKGGYLVQTEYKSFIELLRDASIIEKSGATVMNGLVGNVSFPRELSEIPYHFVAEGEAGVEGDIDFGMIDMAPKNITAHTKFSRQLLIQSPLAIEGFVRSRLASSVGKGRDKMAIYGSAAQNEPRGLNNIVGLNTVNFAGDVPTFAEAVQMETEIATDNADIGSMKYLYNAAMRGSLKTALKVAGFPVYLLEGGQLNGYETDVSNMFTAGDIFFGVWKEMIFGNWGGLDLIVDHTTKAKEGQVIVVAHQMFDVIARHAQSFCKGANNP